MGELLFDRDAATKTEQVFHYNEETDQVTIEDRQEVSAILRHNEMVRGNSDLQPGRKSELRKVATIPMNVLFHMRQTWNALGLSWEERQEELRRFLNDPAMADFRTDNRSRV